MSSRYFVGLALIVLVGGYTSCIPFKKSAKRTLPATDSNLVTAVPSDTAAAADVDMALVKAKEELITAFSPLLKTPPAFTTFNGRARMHFEGRGAKYDFTTNFRVKRDEVIWASVTALGGIYQVARLYITPDSFRLINYGEKQVTEMALADAKRVLPVPADFQTLQALIVGLPLSQKGEVTDAADLGGLVVLRVEEPGLLQQVSVNKTDSTVGNVQLQSAELGGPSGGLQFSDYSLQGGYKFPGNRVIHVSSGGDQYYLDMNFNKVEFNQPVDFPFSIPKGYSRK